MAKDKKVSPAEVRDMVRAAHAKRESAEAHDRGVAERLRQVLREEAERN